MKRKKSLKNQITNITATLPHTTHAIKSTKNIIISIGNFNTVGLNVHYFKSLNTQTSK